MRTHGWETHSPDTTVNATPLPTEAINHLYKETGPQEGTPEHAALTEKHGFSYRTLLGELLYAYITC